MVFLGLKNIPEGPAIYVCRHQAWNETLILLGSQRRRLRFFIQQEQAHGKWLKRLYRLLRVTFTDNQTSFENDELTLTKAARALAQGVSVTLFIEDSDVKAEIEKLKASPLAQELINLNEIPLIPVIIEAGEKDKEPPIFKRLFSKFRVPAAISFG